MPARLHKLLHWASAFSLALALGAFVVGKILTAMADHPCASEDGVCPGYLLPWGPIMLLAIGTILAAVSLVRGRPLFLVVGWLIVLLGFEAWWVLQLMFLGGGLWGRETTFSRAVIFVAGKSETLVVVGIVALTALLLLPSRNRGKLERLKGD